MQTDRPPGAVVAGHGSGALLTINAGSSSIRFAVHSREGKRWRRLLRGIVDRIGLSGTTLTCNDLEGQLGETHPLESSDPHSAVPSLIACLEAQPIFSSVEAVRDRVVDAMTHVALERVTAELLSSLRRITPSDREHLPLEIELMETLHQRHPELPQVA